MSRDFNSLINKAVHIKSPRELNSRRDRVVFGYPTLLPAVAISTVGCHFTPIFVKPYMPLNRCFVPHLEGICSVYIVSLDP